MVSTRNDPSHSLEAFFTGMCLGQASAECKTGSSPSQPFVCQYALLW
jgi:hypothetical protein